MGLALIGLDWTTALSGPAGNLSTLPDAANGC